jgi:hypothetical protein
MTIHVSGRMHVLFERHEVSVGGEDADTVPAFSCRWCGFTVVTDTPDDLPDHTCSGPRHEPTFRGEPPPAMSHTPA